MKLDNFRKQYLDTTKWAMWQDYYFQNRKIPPFVEIAEWEPLMQIQNALCGPNNLSIRQYLIRSKAATAEYSAVELIKAIDMINSLKLDGYWLEGYSYLLYTAQGADWQNPHGKIYDDLKTISENYAKIVSPEGTIPLPETRISNVYAVQNSLPDFFECPTYVCKRWRDERGNIRGYLLITKVRNFGGIREPVNNLHYHLDSGNFALWVDGEWVVRCSPYEGFNFDDSFASRSFSNLLPKNSLLPMWRINPPEVRMKKSDNKYSFVWNNGYISDAKRSIEILPNEVVVVDKPGVLFGKEISRRFSIVTN